MQTLHVWKIRRGAETSASVLSTAAILEVQLRDESGEVLSESDLQSLYSGAFTRFLNYVSSIEQRQRKRTMYSIANQLGIESFLVDLRHLCSHGKDSPSLEVFRRSANYCMNWLKNFYWERELKYIQDVDVTSIKVHNTIRFERNLHRLLLLYDAVTEAIHSKCETIEELQAIVTDVERRDLMREYIAQLCEQSLKKVFNCIVSDMFTATKSRVVKESASIFCEQLLKCPYFVKSCVKFPSNRVPLVKLHERFLLEMQINGIISIFFQKCVFVSEDLHESEQNRIAAAFWADKILEGIDLLRNTKTNIRLEKYNSKQELTKAESKSYEELVKVHKESGINTQNVLILWHWILNPIEIAVDESFLERRVKNLSEFTGIYVKRLIQMVKVTDEKKRKKYERILDLIAVGELTSNKPLDPKIYTVEEDVLPLISDEKREKMEKAKKIGIFCEDLKKINWKTIPIGAVFEGTSLV